MDSFLPHEDLRIHVHCQEHHQQPHHQYPLVCRPHSHPLRQRETVYLLHLAKVCELDSFHSAEIGRVKSLGKVVAPFVFSPLTALFLSNDAPFYFPGFSLLCISLSSMIDFLQSLMIKDVPYPPLNKAINNNSSSEEV